MMHAHPIGREASFACRLAAYALLTSKRVVQHGPAAQLPSRLRLLFMSDTRQVSKDVGRRANLPEVRNTFLELINLSMMRG